MNDAVAALKSTDFLLAQLDNLSVQAEIVYESNESKILRETTWGIGESIWCRNVLVIPSYPTEIGISPEIHSLHSPHAST